MINQDLLEILACPECKGPVKLDEEKKGLSVKNANLFIPYRMGYR